MPVGQQPLAHVRADEARRPRDADVHAGFLSGRDARAACRACAGATGPRSPCRPASRWRERRVRKRRCGESGSKRRSKPPAAIGQAGGAAVRRRGHGQRAATGAAPGAPRRGGAARRARARASRRRARGRSSSPRTAAARRGPAPRAWPRARAAPHARAPPRTRRPASASLARSSAASRPSPHPRSSALSTGVERAHEGGQVLRRRRAVVGHQLPELVVVPAGYQAPFALITAGTVFSRIERSRKTDQCSR